jgi:hypothetical protein
MKCEKCRTAEFFTIPHQLIWIGFLNISDDGNENSSKIKSTRSTRQKKEQERDKFDESGNIGKLYLDFLGKKFQVNRVKMSLFKNHSISGMC